MIFKFFIFFISYYNVLANYYQVMEEFNINFRTNEIPNFYNNFEREGNLVVYDDYINMAPKNNNSYGLFYTKQVK